MIGAIAAAVISGVASVAGTYLSVKAVMKGGFGFLYSLATTLAAVSYTVFGVSLYALYERIRRARGSEV